MWAILLRVSTASIIAWGSSSASGTKFKSVVITKLSQFVLPWNKLETFTLAFIKAQGPLYTLFSDTESQF